MAQSFDVPGLIRSLNAQRGWSIQLKDKQQLVLEWLMKKENVLAILPTGYGKSLPYMLHPLLMDLVHQESAPHASIVVSPLRSLMKDQADRCDRMGISCAVVTAHEDMCDDHKELIQKKMASVILCSPEALFVGGWMKTLREQNERVSLVAVDEVHCVSEWGSDFRPEYLKVVQLRSIFTVPLLCLSATVNKEMLKDITKILRIDDGQYQLVSVVPDRKNIFLDIRRQGTYDVDEDLQWIVQGLKERKTNYPKTIIFAQTVSQVTDIFENFTVGLRADGRTDKGERLFSMFHGQVSPELQKFTVGKFSRTDSTLRVLISTIAFGMGVEVPDVQQVIHWSKSSSLITHWQEVGRAGRNGEPAVAIWYPKSTHGVDREIFEKLKSEVDCCIRKVILNSFLLPGMDVSALDELDKRVACAESCTSCTCAFCLCCSNCRDKCKCYIK